MNAASPRAPRPDHRPSAVAVRRRRLGALGAGLTLLLAVVVVVALLLRGGSEDAQAAFARAFADGSGVKTAQIDLKLGLSGSAAADGEPLMLTFAGPYQAGDAKSARFQLDVDLNGSGEPVATLVGVDGRNYVTVGKQPYVLAADALDDLKDERGKDDEGLSLEALGIDPQRWLRDPQTVGDERWEGATVRHVRSDVDVPRMVADLKKVVNRASSSQKVGDEAEAAVKTLDGIRGDITAATMDVWVADGKGALRRLQLDIRLKDGRLALDLGLRRINLPVRIDAPKDARPFDELMTAFAALSGERGATGTTTEPAPSGTSATPAPSTTTGGEYARCVEAAGSDVDELAACAKLGD